MDELVVNSDYLQRKAIDFGGLDNGLLKLKEALMQEDVLCLRITVGPEFVLLDLGDKIRGVIMDVYAQHGLADDLFIPHMETAAEFGINKALVEFGKRYLAQAEFQDHYTKAAFYFTKVIARSNGVVPVGDIGYTEAQAYLGALIMVGKHPDFEEVPLPEALNHFHRAEHWGCAGAALGANILETINRGGRVSRYVENNALVERYFMCLLREGFEAAGDLYEGMVRRVPEGPVEVVMNDAVVGGGGVVDMEADECCIQ